MTQLPQDNMYEVCLTHSRADRAFRLALARSLDEFKLTMMEWLLLATICEGPKQGLTMTEVAEALDVTLPQITALMNQIVTDAYLEQKISEQDRRSRRLVCTRSGKNLVGKVNKSVQTALASWFEAIPQDELQQYLNTQQKLATLATQDK